MAAELVKRLQPVIGFIGRVLDVANDKFHNEERGRLDDGKDLTKLSILLGAANERLWTLGTLDPRVDDLLAKVEPENVDIKRHELADPAFFILIDSDIVAFEGENFLVMRGPKKKFLEQFESHFK